MLLIPPQPVLKDTSNTSSESSAPSQTIATPRKRSLSSTSSQSLSIPTPTPSPTETVSSSLTSEKTITPSPTPLQTSQHLLLSLLQEVSKTLASSLNKPQELPQEALCKRSAYDLSKHLPPKIVDLWNAAVAGLPMKSWEVLSESPNKIVYQATLSQKMSYEVLYGKKTITRMRVVFKNEITITIEKQNAANITIKFEGICIHLAVLTGVNVNLESIGITRHEQEKTKPINEVHSFSWTIVREKTKSERLPGARKKIKGISSI